LRWGQLIVHILSKVNMRTRYILMALVIALVSTGATSVFFAIKYYSLKKQPTQIQSATNTLLIKTNVVVRRQFFSWSDIESEDFTKYIQNLRDIGCPEQTIRDIIVSEVNQVFSQRRDLEVTTPEQQWWKSVPDPEVIKDAIIKVRALDNERRELLTKLLGPDWEQSGAAESWPPQDMLAETIISGWSNGRVILDGPVLGKLSPEIKKAVQRISREAWRRQQEYLESQELNGKPISNAKLAILRQQTREELSKILTPQQLEEYLLRYSQTAENLRRDLRGIEVSPEEFRKLFVQKDAIDMELDLLADKADAASIQRVRQLELQKDQLMNQVLGSNRSQLVKLQKDPVFIESQKIVQESGASADSIMPLYRVNRETELQIRKIQQDNLLTDEEKQEIISQIKSVQDQTLKRLLGDRAYQKFKSLQENTTQNGKEN